MQAFYQLNCLSPAISKGLLSSLPFLSLLPLSFLPSFFSQNNKFSNDISYILSFGWYIPTNLPPFSLPCCPMASNISLCFHLLFSLKHMLISHTYSGVYVCGQIYSVTGGWGSEGNFGSGRFSSSNFFIPGSELRSSGLVTSAFSYWALDRSPYTTFSITLPALFPKSSPSQGAPFWFPEYTDKKNLNMAFFSHLSLLSILFQKYLVLLLYCLTHFMSSHKLKFFTKFFILIWFLRTRK